METSLFDFDLPAELVAQRPAEPRDRSRLMVVSVAEGAIEHRSFAELPELLRPGDALVRNDTKVIAARLLGTREATGGRWEGLYLRTLPGGDWEILAKTRGRVAPGEVARLDGGLGLTLAERLDGGRWVAQPDRPGDAEALLSEYGHVPIPPYIRKGVADPGDHARYQTTYAATPGAVAAPTAGLHFTAETFDRLADRGVSTHDITLHVGVGTFRPIEAERIEDHALHAERATLSAGVADALNAARARGGRVVAVGTTTARTLETAAGADGIIAPFDGETALYLRPGHAFRGVDALVTNFHLPRSSLLVLVSALAGVELARSAYEAAIRDRYRFYSYGDAMLVMR